MSASLRHVKLVSRQKVLWRRQLPGWGNRWGDTEFIFDEDARDYDFLAVFDDLPAEREALACSKENTILIVTEPIVVKLYPPAYTRQFGVVVSAQERFAIKNPNVLLEQTAFPWSYGIAHGSQDDLGQWAKDGMGFDDLAAMLPPPKSKIISTVCSHKGDTVNLKREKVIGSWRFHRHRLHFTQSLAKDLPELDFFGRDSRPVADKKEAIDDYRLHLVVENYPCDHWWTEKLADAYLGYALPVFHGCANLADYFPAESFIPINIYKPEEARKIIRAAMAEGEYEKRLPAIKEARRRLLYEHNIFALLERTAANLAAGNGAAGGEICNIKTAMRGKNFMARFINKTQYKITLRKQARRYLIRCLSKLTLAQ